MQPWRVPGWLGLALVLWLGTSGIISSNDGSHLALARALVLRGETTIDPEVALTLWVDRARREGHQYSDRPPGTAFAAAPAVWLGAQLDPWFLRKSLQDRELVFTPAAPAFLAVYTARSEQLGARARPILAYQGTALLLSLHTVAIGMLGLWAVARLLARRAIGGRSRAFAVAALGLATLWGPYSTVLFSHVTTGTLVACMLLALDHLRDTEGARPRALLAVAAGAAASWATSADYLAGVLALGLGVAAIDWRRDARVLPWLLVGAIPPLLATLAYHDAAFGSPWSIGYDHQANFEFARERSSTFSGELAHGLWVQWGLGEGAGVLALAPVAVLGVLGLVRSPWQRHAIGALPWIVALALHRTPEGGGSEDHRYLVPLLPLVGLGLGALWERFASGTTPRSRGVAAALLALALLSALLGWSHFLRIRS